MRRASARAATRRGCSRIVRPIAASAGGMRVVLPEPGGATIDRAAMRADVRDDLGDVRVDRERRLHHELHYGDQTKRRRHRLHARRRDTSAREERPDQRRLRRSRAQRPARTACKEGEGGVFGTSGGGTYDGGMHDEERDAVGSENDSDEALDET